MSIPTGFDVIEFRRYTVVPEERAHFGRAFETYFPEAFQQLGAMIFGQFCERDDPSRFTWIRGFHDLPARQAVNQAFYDGPLWREHAATMNDRLIDHTDVLLLEPVAGRAIPTLPTVDAIHEVGGASGVIVAHVLPVRAEALGEVVGRADELLAVRGQLPLRDAGLLETLDVPNNYPRLPFRTDIPFVVWLGILPDDAAVLGELRARAAEMAAGLADRSYLRAPAELLVLDPTRRSRLRWQAP